MELEVRKNLDFLSSGFAPFTVFANTTLMQSEITPGSDVLTNANRPMVGQAQYVVNAGLTYSGASGVNATALYNVVGARISRRAPPFPDSYEQARHVVDVSVQVPVFTNTTFRLDRKNLIDAPYRVIQGGITRALQRRPGVLLRRHLESLSLGDRIVTLPYCRRYATVLLTECADRAPMPTLLR